MFTSPIQGFPGGSEVIASACNVGDLGSIPGSGRFPWRRKWLPTPVFSPGESHGWRSLVGYSPRGCKELDTTGRRQFHFVPFKPVGSPSAQPLCSFILSRQSLIDSFKVSQAYLVEFLPQIKGLSTLFIKLILVFLYLSCMLIFCFFNFCSQLICFRSFFPSLSI